MCGEGVVGCSFGLVPQRDGFLGSNGSNDAWEVEHDYATLIFEVLFGDPHCSWQLVHKVFLPLVHELAKR